MAQSHGGSMTPPPHAGTSFVRYLPAVTVLALAAVAAYMSWRMGSGTPAKPGPGLWPLMVSVALCVLAAVDVVSARRGPDLPRPPVAPVLIGGAGLAGFIALLPYTGPTLPCFAVLLLWLRALGREPWRRALTIAAVATAVLWFVFRLLLAVPFPPGLLYLP